MREWHNRLTSIHKIRYFACDVAQRITYIEFNCFSFKYYNSEMLQKFFAVAKRIVRCVTKQYSSMQKSAEYDQERFSYAENSVDIELLLLYHTSRYENDRDSISERSLKVIDVNFLKRFDWGAINSPNIISTDIFLWVGFWSGCGWNHSRGSPWCDPRLADSRVVAGSPGR